MKSTVFFTLIFTSVLFADAPVEATSLDLEILDRTFNLELEEAFRITEEQIQRTENSPKYYFYYVNVMMMEYGVKLNQSAIGTRGETKEKLTADIIKYCEVVEEKFEDAELSTEEKFYFAGILGYLARSYGLVGSWWGAFQSGQDAQSLMEEVLEENPEYYDAYLMLGMFEYFADRMSGITSFIASILGFSGDRDTGLEYINLAYEKGSPATFGQASLMMIEIYTRMEENSFTSLRYFERFLEKYPRNFRINSWYGRELIRTWNYKKAGRLIENDSLGVVDANVRASYYSGIGDSENAIKYSRIVLENSDTHYRWIKRNNQYIYIINNWLLGNQEEVDKYLAELNEDQRNWVNEIMEHPEDSKWLANFSSAIARGESQSYMETFLNDTPEFKLAENEFRRYYYSGIYYYGIEDYENAEFYFDLAKTAEDRWIGYEALKYLVEIYINNNTAETAKVELLIEEIDDREDESLSFRAKELSTIYKLD